MSNYVDEYLGCISTQDGEGRGYLYRFRDKKLAPRSNESLDPMPALTASMLGDILPCATAAQTITWLLEFPYSELLDAHKGVAWSRHSLDCVATCGTERIIRLFRLRPPSSDQNFTSPSRMDLPPNMQIVR